MSATIVKVMAATLAMVITQSVSAESGVTTSGAEKWMMKMIYQPSQPLLEREARGVVHVYDGLTDRQVEDVLDQKFDRLEHMMFTGVKKTDEEGKVVKNPQTGKAVASDDGCD
jgi:hypothetical protein